MSDVVSGYEEAGAAGLSILTNKKYFDGDTQDIIDIRDISNPLLLELAAQKKTGLSKLKREISITLISANFGKYLKLIFKKFYDSTWLFVFIPFFMLLAGFIGFLNNKSKFSLVIIFLSIFTLSNHSVVYLFGRVQPRYLIYTDFILLVFILILFSVFLKKKNTTWKQRNKYSKHTPKLSIDLLYICCYRSWVNLKISLIIPVYNESGEIENFFNDLKKCNFDLIDEIIFVNDFSNDNSLELLQKKNKWI